MFNSRPLKQAKAKTKATDRIETKKINFDNNLQGQWPLETSSRIKKQAVETGKTETDSYDFQKSKSTERYNLDEKRFQFARKLFAKP